MNKNNILTIVKKEFARFFGDKRLVFTTMIMPGLLIYVIYTFMLGGIRDTFEADKDYRAKVYVQNMPKSVQPMFEGLGMDISNADDTDIESIKSLIENKEVELLVVFPPQFDSAVANYNVADTTQMAPNVLIYSNVANIESDNAEGFVRTMLTSYEETISNKFNINAYTEETANEKFDLATDEDFMGKIFSSMLPFMLLIFLYSGCMAVAPESISGEKERGTIATLLVTPMSRSHLAFGKIISLSFIALISGLSSFLGVMLSLPEFIGSEIEGLSTNIYTTSDYLLILGIILSTVLILISLISIISAYAKTVKEATTLVLPLMIVIMMVGLTSMIGGGEPQTSLSWYLIPVYNSVQAMTGIFSFNYSLINVGITIVVNIIYAGAFSYVLAKMFNSEKIMFSK
ncbi:MAG: ABC transporter permease [Bacteroidales bacterium]|nr:ABC transporter permease [Bacteroidales bacterium]